MFVHRHCGVSACFCDAAICAVAVCGRWKAASILRAASGAADVWSSTDGAFGESVFDFAVCVAVVCIEDRRSAGGIFVVTLFVVHRLWVAQSHDCRMGSWASGEERKAGAMVVAISDPILCGSCFVCVRSDLLFDALHQLEWDVELVGESCVSVASTVLVVLAAVQNVVWLHWMSCSDFDHHIILEPVVFTKPIPELWV